MNTIRKGTQDRIIKNLSRHEARMNFLVALGVERKEASTQAYEELQQGKLNADGSYNK